MVNRNQRPELLEPCVQKSKVQLKPEPSIKTVEKYRENLSPEEPSEPKTGTARTVPRTNRNRTEPNQGHPGSPESALQWWNKIHLLAREWALKVHEIVWNDPKIAL